MALRGKQAAFVLEYLKDRNATQAAIRAGYSMKTAGAMGHENLTKPEIADAILAEDEENQKTIRIGAVEVAQMWSEAATVDRNELTEVRRHCCRYCWGVDHEYHETPKERRVRREDYERLIAATPETDWPAFKELGGVGYNRNQPMNPACPECFGDGEMTVIMKDTRTLSRGARQIFEGVKVTKDGIEIRMMDRGSAIAGLAKSLGMDKSVNLNLNMNIDATAVPDDPMEASRVYQRLVGG